MSKHNKLKAWNIYIASQYKEIYFNNKKVTKIIKSGICLFLGFGEKKK